MDIPENLCKYITVIGPYQARWHDMLLSFPDIHKLKDLTPQQLEDIEYHGLFKDDKQRTCRYIPGRKTPLTVDEVIMLVTGNFTDHKNKRHNPKTDYKINWTNVEKRKLLEDFTVATLQPVPNFKVKDLPAFHKHFPIHLIQRLSEMSDIQFNNIFERKLLWNPYLINERFGHDLIKGKEFVHNPLKLNDHKSCFGYDKTTKRTIRYKESALGYDFWNHIFWLARLSPEKWEKIDRYNLLMFSAYDMVCYMNLDNDVLEKATSKAIFRHIHYAFAQNTWNVTLKLNVLDDLSLRKYGKLYEDIAHYKKAPELQALAATMSLGYGVDSADSMKKDLKFRPMSMDECFKILNNFGISWAENMPIESLTAQYRQLAKKYHPDINNSQRYLEQFNQLAIAVNTLKKHILYKTKR